MGGAREWRVGPLQDPPRGVAAAMAGGVFGVGEEATGCWGVVWALGVGWVAAT